MDQLIKLVRTYRLSDGLAERLQLANEIFRLIEPRLRLFVFGALARPAAEDVHQEALKGVAAGLAGFAGSTPGEFWGWCYRIARNKVSDHLRKQAAERAQLMPPEELMRLVEVSGRDTALSSADRLDLEYALKLLAEAKPECRDYLWKHYILGLDYREIAEEQSLTYDNVRMRIGRCLDEAQSLIS
ncbi:MAG: sigma-70 family RNA polymerase sigma factor [Verrucomicrobia bacterium]|nr:sigma-70 family RNA polymerase sigma factor [Verrucomicrobiota bacterium]